MAKTELTTYRLGCCPAGTTESWINQEKRCGCAAPERLELREQY